MELPPPHILTDINDVLVLFRMPLFFFISGYFTYSAYYDIQLLKKRSYNRIVRQLYPTILLWFLFCVLFMDESFSEMPFNIYKSGYWFTFVTVEIFFMIAPLLFLFSKYNLSRFTRVLILVGLCIIIQLSGRYLFIHKGYIEDRFCDLFSIFFLVRYAKFFILGLIVKMYKDTFDKLCKNLWFFACCMGIFISLISFPQLTESDMGAIMTAVSGIFVFYCAFAFLGRLSFKPVNRSLELLAVIGTSTLEIYLLHYFFVYTIRNGINLYGVVQFAESPMYFPIFIAISTAIAVLCLYLVGMLKKCGLYNYFFPPVTGKTNPVKSYG